MTSRYVLALRVHELGLLYTALKLLRCKESRRFEAEVEGRRCQALSGLPVVAEKRAQVDFH